jgi:hypothetical protein
MAPTLPAISSGQNLRIFISVILIVAAADYIAVADQAVFADRFGFIEITDDQPALQGVIKRCRCNLSRGELPMLGRSAIDAFDVQVIVLVEGEFEGMQAVDFDHTAVFEGVEKRLGSHGKQSF